ncbi:MAG TPA: hypothetical protein VJ654_15595 [Noviherbaspirillum sp.]|nr:hypothetical protein [Noviherbaspirillum sp.]
MLAVLRSKNLRKYGAAGMLCLATLAFADEPSRAPAGQSTETSAKQDKKWQSDDVVRKNMESIRQLMAANKENIEKDQLKAQDYLQLAQSIDKNIAALMKDHKLSKDAYKALHIVALTDMMRGTELMRSAPKLQAQRVGAMEVLQSLHNYGKYFEHPGWSTGDDKAK